MSACICMCVWMCRHVRVCECSMIHKRCASKSWHKGPVTKPTRTRPWLYASKTVLALWAEFSPREQFSFFLSLCYHYAVVIIDWYFFVAPQKWAQVHQPRARANLSEPKTACTFPMCKRTCRSNSWQQWCVAGRAGTKHKGKGCHLKTQPQYHPLRWIPTGQS